MGLNLDILHFNCFMPMHGLDHEGKSNQDKVENVI